MDNSDNPRQAVILAAGLGSRLRPLTDMRPKPLVEVHGVSIIHNALRNLEAVGIRSATIVVGYRKDAIEYACGARFGGIDITYVESSVFDRTGSAYSLWLAREALLQGDILLLEGDVFFELRALKWLLAHGSGDVAAIATFDDTMEGSAVVLDPDGIITEIRMKQSAASLNGGPSLFKTMNLFRLSADTLRSVLAPALDELIRSGATAVYTEQLLAHLIHDRGLRMAAACCDGFRWYEIDSEADLRMAEGIFASAPVLEPDLFMGK